MKYTNNLGLPDSIVQAVTNDPYDAGQSDISVTRLISSPYQVQLINRHRDELTEDVSDRIWALMGQVGHGILERMDIDLATSVAEERLFLNARELGFDFDYIISGAFDLIEKGELNDFKFTSVWSRDGKIEWEQQLNMLRYLCAKQYEKTGDSRYIIAAIRIIAIYRDWQKSKTVQGDYPKSQVEPIEVDLWPLDKAEEFIKERIRLHTDPNPEPCTDEERWATKPVFALMKDGRKSAVKLYEDKDEADAACASAGKGHTVVERPKTYRRCESYCSAATVCPVWQEYLSKVPF